MERFKQRDYPYLNHFTLPGFACVTLLLLFFLAINESGISHAAPQLKPSMNRDINTRQFEVKIIRQSRSGAVILLENRSSLPSPNEARVLLLKRGDQPAIAVRVMKTLQDSDSFIAKVLKNYGSTTAPTSAEVESLTAFEKVSDKAPPPATLQDKVDVKELEESIQPEPLQAPEARASISRPQKQTINSLKIDTENIRVRPVLRQGAPMGLADIRGNFNRQGASLLYNAKYQIFPNSKGDFTIHLPIKAETTKLNFSLDAVTGYGTVEHEEMMVNLPEWAIWNKTLATAPVLSVQNRNQDKIKFYFSAGIGATYQGYTETGASSFRQFALTPKFSATYNWVPLKWDLGINFFLSALPFGSNDSSVTFRVFGANARIGYRLPQGSLGFSPDWQLRVMLGAYYTTTFVSPRLFGYENAAGPQIYPVISRTFAGGRVGSFYFKYSPISNGLSFFTLENAELAAGLSYQPFLLAWRDHPLSLTLDFARLKLSLANGGSLQSSSLTLGAAVEF